MNPALPPRILHENETEWRPVLLVVSFTQTNSATFVCNSWDLGIKSLILLLRP